MANETLDLVKINNDLTRLTKNLQLHLNSDKYEANIKKVKQIGNKMLKAAMEQLKAAHKMINENKKTLMRAENHLKTLADKFNCFLDEKRIEGDKRHGIPLVTVPNRVFKKDITIKVEDITKVPPQFLTQVIDPIALKDYISKNPTDIINGIKHNGPSLYTTKEVRKYPLNYFEDKTKLQENRKIDAEHEATDNIDWSQEGE